MFEKRAGGEGSSTLCLHRMSPEFLFKPSSRHRHSYRSGKARSSPQTCLDPASKMSLVARNLPLSMSILCMATIRIDRTESVAGPCVLGPQKFQALCESCNARADRIIWLRHMIMILLPRRFCTTRQDPESRFYSSLTSLVTAVQFLKS